MNNEIMSCFSCVDMIPTPTLDDSSSSEVERNVRREENKQAAEGGDDSTCCCSSSSSPKAAGNVLAARRFSFDELAMATQNFREANLIGEGGFGSVYKGRLLSSGTVVAVKQLNLEGLQGNQEFVVEVLVLSLLEHPNLVKLIGYCTDGDQRLLVYEFMAMGSLENHLFLDLEEDQQQKPLSWRRRMKIALGAARGLEYLHCTVDPPIIYRDLKSSNILLDREFNVKLSDFGLAKLGPVGDKTHVSTRVMGTYGYCAPEYAMSGKLTTKSDIYSFGVVLLELITGRMAIDSMRKPGEHNLVAWARPFLKDNNNGANKYVELVDPLLQGRFSVKSLHHAVAITTMCLQEQAPFRPVITDIVTALDYIVSDLNNRRSRRRTTTSRTRSSSSSPNSQS